MTATVLSTPDGSVEPTGGRPRPPGPGKAPRKTGSLRRRVLKSGRRILVPVLLVAVWQLASSVGWLNPTTFASPGMVWDRFVEFAQSGVLADNVLASLRRVVLGLLIGVAIGVVLGLATGLSRVADELVDPPLQMLRAVPTLGLMPLLLLWLGIDEALKVGLVAIGVIFPIYLNFSKGIRSVDPRFRELAQSCGASRWTVIRHIILPGALPHLLIGLRFSLAIAWLSLVFGETVAADSGIGYMLTRAKDFLQTDTIVLCLALYALLGLAIESLVRVIEWKTLSWRREFVDS
ncbi:ABC transporter permease [Polymorphospora rubra]|uniref:ABC transporter permease n=1 Tax=Polymorphospora rubra TaxID=338584 RepID=A0A810NC16_9ACTN|nr:ABC transporter permease [Polymorphospora rubra]BCJ69083.1 ABC transporter permease [Polymorphospora rubra]